jgi:hypothetical protein
MKVLGKMRGYFRVEFIEATGHVDILAHAVARRN